MNKIYRLIWSKAKKRWAVVSEKTGTKGGCPAATVGFIALAGLLAAGSAQAIDLGALPTGGQIVSGQGSIAQVGSQMTVTQGTDRMIATWETFNIGQDAGVRFNQPGASSVALNRIFDQNPSQILGSLTANGQVFLLNPSGIVFGQSAQVDVGGLVASSLNMGNESFLAGRYTFEINGLEGRVENMGSITANGGVVALIAPQVSNSGTITAQNGAVVLAAGEKVSLDFAGDGLLSYSVEQGAVDALAENRGLIRADGGLVVMTAKAADALTRTVVNNEGVVEARGMSRQGGRIILDGGDSGVTRSSGALDVSSDSDRGGHIEVTGRYVAVEGNARLDASGASGGGQVLVGGSWQHSDPAVRQAVGTFIGSDAVLSADATVNGNGGTVVAWSDVTDAQSVTRAYGAFWARGGSQGGDGGRIETSGHWLDTAGSRGSASASYGRPGLWLFDPYNVTIAGAASAAGSFASAGGTDTWIPSGSGSTILNTDINTKLEAGTNVTVTTGAAGGEIGDVTIDAAITKAAGDTDVTFTVNAANSIVANQAISNTGGAGKLHVVLDADNNSGTGDGAGIVLLNADITTGGGNLSFGTGRTATINGVSTLVGGDVYVAGAGARTLSTGGGNVNIQGEMIVANTDGLTVSSGNGNVRFYGLLNSGNSYASVNAVGDWTAALAAAASGAGSGVGDTYLATITSRLENAVAARTANYNASWLGARRVAGIGTNTAWRWVAGPEGLQDGGNGLQFFTQNGSDVANGSGGSAISGRYSNWNAGEPNNWGGANLASENESALQFVGTLGQWNDLPKAGNNLSYYVKETNLAASPVTVNAGTGTVTFSGAVGTSKALASLNVTGSTIAIDGGAVTTEGTQTYSNNVTLGSAATNLTQTNANTDFTLQANKSISNASGADASLTIKTTRSIIMNSGSAITSSTGRLNTVLWADSDASGSGSIFFTGTNDITTNGGGIWMGGGSGTASWTPYSGAGALTVGDSYAVGDGVTSAGGARYRGGIEMSSATNLTTSGGNIALYGKGYNASSLYSLGIVSDGGTIDAGAGKILMDAVSRGNGTVNSQAVSMATAVNIKSASSAADAITITGDASGTTAGFASIGINMPINGTIQATGGGGIALTATSGSATNVWAFQMNNANVLANSGAISLTGITQNAGHNSFSTGGGFTIGQKAGTDVTSSSSNITITGNKISTLAGTDILASSGTLTVRPYSSGTTIGIAGGAGTLSLPASYFSTNFVNGFSGITVGSNTAGAITVGGATTLNDSTTLLTNSTIAINGAVSANENLALTSNGTITQSQALGVTGTTTITAGAGNNVTLDNASNNFTGAVSVVSGNNVSLRDTDAMIMGASTVSGNLTLVTGGALTQSGDLAVTGTTSITAGAGNNVTLDRAGNNFTGAVSVVSGNNVSLKDADSITLGASDVSGDFTVEALSGDLTIAGNIGKTSGADATATFKASRDVIQNDNVTISSSSNKLHTVLRSDSDAAGGGAIKLKSNSAITSNGGNVTLSGGGDVTTGYATASSAAMNQGIALLASTSINAGGGNVLLRGKSLQATDSSWGVLQRGSVTTSGTGTITYVGDSSGVTSGNLYSYGIYLDATLGDSPGIRSGSGAISLTGMGGQNTSYGHGLVLEGAGINVESTSGDISLTGTGSSASHIFIGAGDKVGKGGLADSSSNITLTSDRLSLAGSLESSGTLIIQPYSANTSIGIAGGSGTLSLPASYFSTNFANGFSGITVGKSDAGTITMGGAVTYNDPLTFKTAGSIIMNTNSGLTGGVGQNAHLVLWADADAADGGYIRLGQTAPITTNGGHLWMGGGSGSAAWNGLTVGNGYAQGTTAIAHGIYLDNGAITTGGGNIAMYGKSAASGAYAALPDGQNNASGIYSSYNNQYSINSGTGSIYLNAIGLNQNASYVGDALYLNGGTMTSAKAAGDAIILIGDGSAVNMGADSRGTGISILGWDATRSNTISATGGGNIVLTGTGTTQAAQPWNYGIRVSTDGAGTNDITTSGGTGNITLTGTANDANTTRSVGFETADSRITSSGNLVVNGSGKAVDLLGRTIVTGTTTLNAAGQDITANNANNDFTGAVTVVSGNNVSLRDANAIVLGGASATAGTLSLTAGTNISGSGTLDIGGMATLNAGGGSGTYSGVISGAGGLTKTGNGTLVLSGANTYTGTTAVNGGTLAVSNAAGLGDVSSGTTVASGATLDLQGGLTFAEGLNLNGGTLSSSAGTNTVSGTVGLGDASTINVSSDTALLVSGQVTASGNAITIAGGGDAHLNNASNTLDGGASITSARYATLKTAGALSLGASSVSANLILQSGGALTQTGDLAITGTTSITAGAGNDVTLDRAGNDFTGAVSVVSGNHVSLRDTNAITLGTSTISGNLDLQSGGNVAQTGALTVTGTTSIDAGAGSNITLGTINNFIGAVSVVSGNNVVLGDINAMELGASTISGNLTLTTANGAVTQSGALSVTGTTSFLQLTPNSITLNNPGNNFSSVSTSTNVGNLSLIDSNELSLGAISSTGTVDIATLNGNLTLTGAINTTDATANAVKLNAGKNAAAGTAAGGNIVVSGGSVSIGAGGRATLFSGDTADTTLAALVGSGSGRFRYNSDETDANYTTALGAGSYAIYRERPTLTVTADNKSMTYGGAVPALTTTVAGYKNGDTLGQAISTAATVSIGGGTSTSGNYTAGNHALTPAGAAGGLGYGLAYADGTLAVGQKALAVTYTGQNKLYDGTISATVTTADDRVAGDALTIGRSAAFTDKNAGNGKTVNVSGVSLGGADAANYTVAATGSATASIMFAPLTVTASNKSKTQGGANPTLDGTITGFVSGETLAVLSTQPGYSTPATTASPAGIYPINASGAAADNYSFIYVDGALTVSTGSTQSSSTETVASSVTSTQQAVNGSQDQPGTQSNVSGNPMGPGAGGGALAAFAAAPPLVELSIAPGAMTLTTGTQTNPLSVTTSGGATVLGLGAGQQAASWSEVGSLPIFTQDAGSAPAMLGMFRVMEAPAALSLVPTSGSAGRSQPPAMGSVAQEVSFVLTLADGMQVTMTAGVTGDGVLVVRVPGTSEAMDVNTVVLMAMQALRQGGNISLATIRSVIVQRH